MEIFPSVYFGNIGFYAELFKLKEAKVGLNERYEKQTYRSRTTILGANGVLNLSVPVNRPNGKETKVFEVEITYSEKWNKEHVRAIESAYRNSPYFIYYFEEIKLILEKEYRYLQELNQACINLIVDKLGLSVELEFDQSLEPSIAQKININPKSKVVVNVPRYIQAFEERYGFVGNVSILDLLFNEGPNSITILQETYISPSFSPSGTAS